jgi:hypothetical protein
MITDERFEKVAQELSYVFIPQFSLDSTRELHHYNEMVHIYSSGLFNLVDGVTSVSELGRQYFNELSAVKFHVKSMRVKHGYHSGIEFTIGTSLGEEHRTISFEERSSELRVNSYTVENVAIYYNFDRVLRVINKYLEQPMQLKRITKSHAGKRAIEELLSYVDEGKYRYSDSRKGALNYFLADFFKIDLPIKMLIGSVEEEATLKTKNALKEMQVHDRNYFEAGSSEYIPELAKLALFKKYQNDPEFEKAWEGSYLDKKRLITKSINIGMATWIDGEMALHSSLDGMIEESFNTFRDKFMQFFTNGKWVVTEYSLRYISFSLAYVYFGENNEKMHDFYIQFTHSGNRDDLLKLFKMFDLTDTLVTSLCKSLSIDMITEMAAKFLDNNINQKEEGNIRGIITLMTEKLESKEEAK